MKEPLLSLTQRSDIMMQGKIERAVRDIDLETVTPLRPLLRIKRRYKAFAYAQLRTRFPDDAFNFRFYDCSWCFFVCPANWWSWYRPQGPLLEIARANERRHLAKILDTMDESDPDVCHPGDLDPDVTLALLRERYPRDRFGYTRIYSQFAIRFYLRR